MILVLYTFISDYNDAAQIRVMFLADFKSIDLGRGLSLQT